MGEPGAVDSKNECLRMYPANGLSNPGYSNSDCDIPVAFRYCQGYPGELIDPGMFPVKYDPTAIFYPVDDRYVRRGLYQAGHPATYSLGHLRLCDNDCSGTVACQYRCIDQPCIQTET